MRGQPSEDMPQQPRGSKGAVGQGWGGDPAAGPSSGAPASWGDTGGTGQWVWKRVGIRGELAGLVGASCPLWASFSLLRVGCLWCRWPAGGCPTPTPTPLEAGTSTSARSPRGSSHTRGASRGCGGAMSWALTQKVGGRRGRAGGKGGRGPQGSLWTSCCKPATLSGMARGRLRYPDGHSSRSSGLGSRPPRDTWTLPAGPTSGGGGALRNPNGQLNAATSSLGSLGPGGAGVWWRPTSWSGCEHGTLGTRAWAGPPLACLALCQMSQLNGAGF